MRWRKLAVGVVDLGAIPVILVLSVIPRRQFNLPRLSVAEWRSHTRGVAAGRGNRISILRGGHAPVGRQTYYRSGDASLMAEFR